MSRLLARRAAHDAGDLCAATVAQHLQEAREGVVALAAKHMIDGRVKRGHRFCHFALAVRAAKNRDRPRPRALDRGEDGDGRGRLLHHCRAADDVAVVSGETFPNLVAEGARLSLYRREIVERNIRCVRAESLGRVGVGGKGRPVERGARKHALAEQKRDSAANERLVRRLADARGESEIGIEHHGRETGPTRAGLQRVEAERRPILVVERRRHEQAPWPARLGPGGRLRDWRQFRP